MMRDYENEYEYKNKIILANGETILWRGKPKKSAYILTKSLVMFPIAIVWLILDVGILSAIIPEGEYWFLIIPFFLLHMMPVWIWLANVISARRRWKNTEYYITNHRIVIQDGFFAVNEISLFYKDIRNTQLKIGLLNRLFHTGNICFDEIYSSDTNGSSGFAFENLQEPQKVYNLVRQTILDIQTDMEYPNAMRPNENPGYKTDYRP